MKNIIKTFSIVLLAFLTACSSPNHNGMSQGILVDATGNTFTLLTFTGDTLSFNIKETTVLPGKHWLTGDTLDIFYKGDTYHAGITVDSFRLHPLTQIENQTLGALLTRTYEGVLPAASCPGIRYTLTVRHQEHSGDGIFFLTLTYLEAENGEDRSFFYTGKRFTQRGIPTDNNATVWQLVPNNGKERVNFLVESDTTLTLLNNRFERNQSELNYTLVQIP